MGTHEKWEEVWKSADGRFSTTRMEVPGGWIYSPDEGDAVYVPNPDAWSAQLVYAIGSLVKATMAAITKEKGE